jgi:hypothetical protein
MPKILLITDVLPTNKHTAGVVLQQFFAQIPLNYELLTYCLHSDALPSYEVSTRITGKMRWTRKPAERWFGPRLLKVLFEKISESEAKLISKDIFEQISRNKPDLIFLVLQGQTMFRIGIALHKYGIKFSTFNWDPLSWWLHHNKSPKRNLQLLHEIHTALNSSGIHILPNPSFANYLKLEFNNFVVFNLAHEKMGKNHKDEAKLLRVCFSGQPYAAREIEFFIKTLDSLDWTIGDFNVELHVFGNSVLGISPHIFHHGWKDPTKLIGYLSFFDCALLPYPSEIAFKEVSKFSFPSKLSTYIAANLPVIYLGPETNPFSMKQKKSIQLVNMNDREGLISSLKNLKYRRDAFSQNIEELFESEFSLTAQKSVVDKFFELHGINRANDPNPMLGSSKRNSRDGQMFIYPFYSSNLIKIFINLYSALIKIFINLYSALRRFLSIRMLKRTGGAFFGLMYSLFVRIFD